MRGLIRAMLAMSLMGLLPGTLPVLCQVEIPITFYILNAGPEVLGTFLLDDLYSPAGCVDTGIPFFFEVLCRDNNTVEDVLSMTLILYGPSASVSDPDSPTGHYTFHWDVQVGFYGEHLVKSECSSPTDQDAPEGTWRFCIIMDKSALAGDWTAVARVSDEAESATRTSAFTVNPYNYLSISNDLLPLHGNPGSETSSRVTIYFKTNHRAQIRARSTGFVGRDHPEFQMGPECLRIDDDPEEGIPETGLPPLVLSPSSQIFVGDLMGESQIDIYIFVSIPDPFLDQDYEGKVVFDVALS